jgi:glyoxylase-like metal-dependent hydrolase (beta-lactamase superfamily II)
MTSVHHINCGYLQRENGPKVGCHCTLIVSDQEVVLVDTGIGMHDIQRPLERIGTFLIEAAGFKFNVQDTALTQLVGFGLHPSDLSHCVVSHLDPDHIGGLSDFPETLVHVSKTEYQDFSVGHPRYRASQMEHQPKVRTYDNFLDNWFGFPAYQLEAIKCAEVYLVPLPGHTRGHCGVGIRTEDEVMFYIGDAFGLKIELEITGHPATEIARANAMDTDLWQQSMDRLKGFKKQHPQVSMFGYHDLSEY